MGQGGVRKAGWDRVGWSATDGGGLDEVGLLHQYLEPHANLKILPPPHLRPGGGGV